MKPIAALATWLSLGCALAPGRLPRHPRQYGCEVTIRASWTCTCYAAVTMPSG